MLLDGGSQQFCFRNAEGQTLSVILSNKIDDASPLTFTIESDDSGTIELGHSSNEETELLALMDRWVGENYSATDLKSLGSRLDAVAEGTSAAAALSMDEQTALLISDLPKLLATRPSVEQ